MNETLRIVCDHEGGMSLWKPLLGGKVCVMLVLLSILHEIHWPKSCIIMLVVISHPR